jgi:tRNA(Ser,Leu) C12 N-acetylase TAN1
MPFAKGDQRINRKGRPREASNSKLREAIRGKMDIQQLWEEIESLDMRDRIQAKLKLLEYAVPRLSTVATVGESIEDQISELTKGEIADLIDFIITKYGEG